MNLKHQTKINIYVPNNSVGLYSDGILLSLLLKHYNIKSYDINISKENIRKGDVGIHIQNYDIKLLDHCNVNILIPNEEWMYISELENLNCFDYVLVKSKYAKSLFDRYSKNVNVIGFFSLDRYFFPTSENKILHFRGRSIQKNHELTQLFSEIKILESYLNFYNENEIITYLNSYNVHICCSLYESWGHYMWEGMSCGKLVICSEIPVFKEYLDPDLVKFVPLKGIYDNVINYNFLNTKTFKLRKGFITDKEKFKELLSDKQDLFEFQHKNSRKIRDNFLYVNNSNKHKFLKLMDFIL